MGEAPAAGPQGALTFAPVDEIAARGILLWQYPPPYDIYNLDPTDLARDLAYLLDPDNRFYAIRGADGRVEAFCSFGADAQVPGGRYADDALDIGLGVRPDLTGQGRGHVYVAAVIGFACRTFAPPSLRVTIAGFNRRAQRVWQQAGFVPVRRFTGRGGRLEFVILTRTAED